MSRNFSFMKVGATIVSSLLWTHSWCTTADVNGDCSHETKRHLLLGRKAMTNLDSLLKTGDLTLPTKVHIVKAMVFPVVMYGCESWAIKKRLNTEKLMLSNCGAGEKTLENPLASKEIKSVNPKGNQPWIFTGRTDAEAPILWGPDVKSWFIGKDPDAGKDWRQKDKGTTENETVGWHHWLNGHEFEQTLGDGKGQGSLACWSPWGRKKSDTTQRLKQQSWYAILYVTSTQYSESQILKLIFHLYYEI